MHCRHFFSLKNRSDFIKMRIARRSLISLLTYVCTCRCRGECPCMDRRASRSDRSEGSWTRSSVLDRYLAGRAARRCSRHSYGRSRRTPILTRVSSRSTTDSRDRLGWTVLKFKTQFFVNIGSSNITWSFHCDRELKTV